MIRLLDLLISFLVALTLSSCATTTAPTESSTKTFDKTINATLDMTSSTSPGSSGSGSAGVDAFTRVNYAAIRNDIASGGGEHLSALAVLLDIPPEERSRFFKTVQGEYQQLYPGVDTPPSQMLAALDRTLVNAELVHR